MPSTVAWRAVAVGLLLIAGATPVWGGISILNGDAAGEGFNDPTPRAPVGGNTGTTLGQQRLIAFQYAANMWANVLDIPVEIVVSATFDPLPCSASGGATLGQAGATVLFRDFTGAPQTNTWYVVALANQLAGMDLAPSNSEIAAQFSSSVGTTCPLAFGWYYGLDASPTSPNIDLVTVVLHELGHGLGFLSTVDTSTGQKFLGFDDAYMRFLENHNTLKLFPAMSNAERVVASVAGSALHWVGGSVIAGGSTLTGGVGANGHVEMYAPNPVEPGSSVSHFNTTLSPSELMEPIYTQPIHSVDLTTDLLEDVGWTLNVCAPVARPDCVGPVSQKGTLTIKDKSSNSKDRLNWTWTSAAALAKTDFGTPTVSDGDGFILCLYDTGGPGGAEQLRMSARVQGAGTCGTKPCWKETSSGFTYTDKQLTPNGIASLKLVSGAAGKAKITVVGKGANLDTPVLPFTTPVTMQLVGGAVPMCWSATYTTPTGNDAALFKAKPD